jgi:hypothetical protein
MDWKDVPSYREKPTRYKAVQYLEGEELPNGILEQTLVEGDWVVRDLLTGRVYVVSEDVFDLIFERD